MLAIASFLLKTHKEFLAGVYNMLCLSQLYSKVKMLYNLNCTLILKSNQYHRYNLKEQNHTFSKENALPPIFSSSDIRTSDSLNKCGAKNLASEKHQHTSGMIKTQDAKLKQIEFHYKTAFDTVL